MTTTREFNASATPPTPARVLVANRGEIALRIIRSIRETGRHSIAIYADQDLESQFVKAADEAYALGGASATDTYLNGDKVIEIALRSGADAIHPGYGFLAENADFARKAIDAGLIWIGPSPDAIDTLGDKVRARQTAVRVGVAPVPGTLDAIKSADEVADFITQYGYPVVLKAADGGGGRGIHVLTGQRDFEHFFTGRDLGGVNGAGFFVERYVPKARHVETQCGRDSLGNFAVYSSRDCSVQRRHQKMIEEAPAPFISEEIANVLVDSSRALFEGVDYVGLGTCEFLLSEDGELYFLEVNPRLQVEHTVTEEVAGVDLVASQLAIASGEQIILGHAPYGHSIELRVTSEDPSADLAPTTGVLTRVVWPSGPGIRIDTGIGEGDAVAPEFDSMVAKIIVTAPTREQAIARALRVTEETLLEGVSTPLSLYAHILNRPEFREPTNGGLGIWTRWLEDGVLEEFSGELAAQMEQGAVKGNPTRTAAAAVAAAGQNLSKSSEVAADQRQSFVIEIDGKRMTLTLPAELTRGSAVAGAAGFAAGATSGFPAAPRSPQPLRSSRDHAKRAEAAVSSDSSITSPMQAIVVRLVAAPGDQVNEGDLVMVLESMKMEKHVYAPRAGILESIDVEPGQNVGPGQVLATLQQQEPEPEGGAA